MSEIANKIWKKTIKTLYEKKKKNNNNIDEFRIYREKK